MWSIVKKDSELIKYFLKYSLKHFSNRDYLCTVLSSIHPIETKTLFQDAIRNRSIHKDKISDEFIKVPKKWMNELAELIEIPSIVKIFYLNNNKRKSFSIVED